MPSYKVLKPAFFNGELYDPEGKRSVLTVDKPFKECPSWAEPIKETSKNQRKKAAVKVEPTVEPAQPDFSSTVETL